ncbi:DNA (cytosine-5-)-methyltransferase [Staphylococcus haemolyticus]|uniref:DNA (cytosine-5-)-methyltransferase n=1 Tax=Staphylococcus haemolyticus TaxID=1283 RepID=UPI00187A9BEA|nr:DNA (cytosine-5-)-methyltransferase [Staphylococcus haemolyticus]MBE7340802.1 DNA (cytosine-5-)-methyltransferase [Staphylococcus haemolyticus]MBE7352395.1 DNA (cytosine-5-)-methyltransferase [Staphylococcus haemolyticus]
MKFIDICSGIGGFRSALEKHGHECMAFAEIDKFAKQSYKAIYDTENEEELDDITSVTDEHFRLYRGQVDIITGGFPCQAFSIAGNRRGFEDTRGTIFFHIARAIKEIQPSYVLLENVKGLLSHDKGRTYGTIVQALDELGYFIEWGLFNSKYWGVPQNRERVYILVTRKDVWKEPKLFNLVKQQTSVDTRLVDILEKDVDESYYLSEEKTRKLTLNEDLSGRLNHYDYRDVDSVHSVNRVSPTLNTMQGGDRQPKVAVPVLTPDRVNKRQNGRRFKENNKPVFTLTSQDRHGIAISENVSQLKRKSFVSKKEFGRMGKQACETMNENIEELKNGTTVNAYNKTIDQTGLSPTLTTRPEGFKTAILPITEDLRIRKLTPLECWRLQGFSDEQFYKAKNSGVSKSQLYKQAGNAVTVNVVDAIVGELE